VPTNPINSATKRPTTAAAVILSQVEPVIKISIPRSSHPLSVKRHDPIATSSRLGLIPIQWFQVEHESGQEDLGISKNFGLD
jgi:hypothetical protein